MQWSMVSEGLLVLATHLSDFLAFFNREVCIFTWRVLKCDVQRRITVLKKGLKLSFILVVLCREKELSKLSDEFVNMKQL